jgi:hypothetical protein
MIFVKHVMWHVTVFIFVSVDAMGCGCNQDLCLICCICKIEDMAFIILAGNLYVVIVAHVD